MDRRTLVILVAGACLLEPLALRAQQAGKVFRIGLLAPFTEPTPGPDRPGNTSHGFARTGLGRRKNLAVEIRWAGVNPQRQRELAAELKALPVALMLAFGTAAIRVRADPTIAGGCPNTKEAWVVSSLVARFQTRGVEKIVAVPGVGGFTVQTARRLTRRRQLASPHRHPGNSGGRANRYWSLG